MPIFQNSIVEKFLNDLEESVIDSAFERFKVVYSSRRIHEIKKLKEEQYQEGFIKDIFGKVLGYTIPPESPINIELEKKNETDAKKVDGAIMKDGEVIGVIELKDNKTKNLDKVKDQAFGYKVNHKGCKYVITSNFQKLRFYIDDATEYEEFDLYNLDRKEFSRFYLFLRKEGLLDRNTPEKLKEETKFHEEDIGKKLYKDYSAFKYKFFDNIVKNNPQYDKLLLFKTSQKFLDRILFVLFAEDKKLIPENAISRIVESWEKADDLHYKPLYELFKILFTHLNVGHTYKSGYEIPAYNGGLFSEDEVLNNLKVDDEVLKDDLLTLSKYDFNTEVDVNILGHIFEHSLSELEQVEAEIKGEVVDKTKGKRKKDGVFYTPKYITKYIVDNTIGKLCDDKRRELKIDDFDVNEYQNKNGKLNTKGKTFFKVLEDYKEWLFELKIVDPACGSGAFLNQALTFLIDEHKFVDDLIAELTNTPLRLFDTDKAILEKNIFGVDINEESVEIAKLSLWLRTAQKGRKLSNLSNNIKCGNSLISDVEVAGDKAFEWQKEFPDVFAKGGFNVVIGNPPYVRQELINKIDKDWLSENYETGNGTADLYVYFYEKSISILEKDGLLGLITPNKFYKTKYGKELRVFLKQFNVIELIDFFELRVFADASTDSQILILNKQKAVTPFSYAPIKSIQSFRDNLYDKIKVSLKELDDDIWVFNNIIDKKILSKISLESITLNEYTNEGIYRGITTGRNEAFIIDKLTRNRLIKEDKKCEKFIKPYINSIDIYSWHIRNNGEKYLLHIAWDFEIEKYPSIKRHLEHFKEALSKRPEVIEGRYRWFAMSRYASDYHQLFSLPKIIYIHTAVKHQFYFDNSGLFINNSCYLISNSDKFLAVWLNSSIFRFYKKLKFVAYGDSSGKGRAKLDYNKMVNTPIPNIEKEEKQLFNEKADLMLYLNKNLQIISNKFIGLLQSDLSLDKVSNKIEKWHSLEWNEFEKELKKKKIVLSGVQKEEWYERFTRLKEEAQSIKAHIDKTDREIDQMVYELYDLTEDEIKIVEES